jgi:hypothetical protein
MCAKSSRFFPLDRNECLLQQGNLREIHWYLAEKGGQEQDSGAGPGQKMEPINKGQTVSLERRILLPMISAARAVAAIRPLDFEESPAAN